MGEYDKETFIRQLKEFAEGVGETITNDGEWTIKGFIDIFKNVYTMSSDTKVISKVLELHLFPYFLAFADANGYDIELARHQNYYPDMTFLCKRNRNIKYAVDLKTTYRDEKDPDMCNGFTLGSHGEYFINRTSTKNIQYPYRKYDGHFCFGIIYSRTALNRIDETKKYTIDQLEEMPTIIKDFVFFAEEKWKIASDKGGSGNTANIGSIKSIPDILSGNGVFAKAGEEHFDEYWSNFGKMTVKDIKTGENKTLSSFAEYLEFRRLPAELNNIRDCKRGGKR